MAPAHATTSNSTARPTRTSTFLQELWLRSCCRRSIPGAVWLPSVGHGRLDEEMLNYFRTHLDRLTEGVRTRPLVFFCYVDCWMSWLEIGYRRVIWYPDGTDGWTASGRELRPASPVPLFSGDD